MKRIALLLLAAFVSTALAEPPPRYRFHRLSPFGGVGQSGALGINSDGTVIGYAQTNGAVHAALWKDGELVDLGILPGAQNSFGIAINDQEQYLAEAAPGSFFRPDLVPAPAGYSIVDVAALNNAGVVAGNARDLNTGGPLAFTWQSGTLTLLPPLIPGGYSTAMNINNAGQVLALAQKTQSDAVPVIYEGTTIVADLSAALTAASFRIIAQGYGLNDHGHVVGFGEVTLRPRRGAPYETVHAFLYRDGKVTDLAPLRGYNYSLAWDVNNSDEIAGTCFSTVDESSTPALWRDGKVYDLAEHVVGGTDGWHLNDAKAINDDGFIIGFAGKNGDQQAFVLEPVNHKHGRR